MGLAGVKQKQRIAADPRNKQWTEDRENFGYRMLTKMGWAEGGGLGKDGMGDAKSPAVDRRACVAGLGAAPARSAAAETYYQLSVFDAILSRANEDLAAVTACPEERGGSDARRPPKKAAKGARTDRQSSAPPKGTAERRAHRRKFIQNKDVGTYSEEHMRQIIGSFP